MQTGLFVNAETGETIERELTAEEIAEITEPEAKRIARLSREAEISRRAAYAVEADPLFFKWQRGEGTEQEWLDAVEAIRKRFPK